MLDGLLQAIENLETFSFVESSQAVIAFSADELVELIRFQLQNGINGDGQPLYLKHPNGKTYYSYAPPTVEYKTEFGFGIGAIVENITLYNTGFFYSSLYVQILDNGDFEILSKDPKYPLLIQKSGDKILTLAPETGVVLEERYAEIFQAHLDKALSA